MDKEVGDLLKAAVAEVLEEVRRPPMPQNSHQTVTLHHADPPPPNPWQTWVCVTCCLVILAAVVVAVPMFNAQMNELNAKIRALDDDNDALRAYINTGILKPKKERDDAE